MRAPSLRGVAPLRGKSSRFLEMSIKSATDTEYHLLSARDLGLVSANDWQKYNAETIEIRKMTFGYRKKVLENDHGEG